MNRRYGGALFREFERLVDPGTLVGLTETQVLARFVECRDPVAFEAIVSRHGPMVLSVSRQMLRDTHDVDDAFQASFVILIQKARGLRHPERLGPWLYGVAYRVAHRARHRRRPSQLPEDLAVPDPDLGGAALQRERTEALHAEIQQLPEKYRVPIVLCYLEGLGGDEAARRLGWPVGTIHGRLSRARDLLRKRLRRRGIAVSTPALESTLLVPPEQLVLPNTVVHSALSLLTGTVPSRFGTLIKGVASAMLFENWKVTGLSLALAIVGIASVSSALLAYQSPAGNRRGSQAADAPQIAQNEADRSRDPITGRPAAPIADANQNPEPEAAHARIEELKVEAEVMEVRVQELRRRMAEAIYLVEHMDDFRTAQPADPQEKRKRKQAGEEKRNYAIDAYTAARIKLGALRRRIDRESKALGVRAEQDQARDELIERMDRIERKLDRVLRSLPGKSAR
jgi:RNA polymerase sigma factor (sigma-70 family)